MTRNPGKYKMFEKYFLNSRQKRGKSEVNNFPQQFRNQIAKLPCWMQIKKSCPVPKKKKYFILFSILKQQTDFENLNGNWKATFVLLLESNFVLLNQGLSCV